MRAAAILGLGCSPRTLKPFRAAPEAYGIEWRMGMPVASDQVDVILLFGGDGTVHRHLGQLVKLGIPDLDVPAGDEHDSARSLGLRGVRASLAAGQKFGRGANKIFPVDLGQLSPIETENAALLEYA